MSDPTATVRIDTGSSADAPCRAALTVPICLELSKARLSLMVAVSAGVGFILASGPSIAWGALGWTVLGTALSAFGANALNQWIEVERDGRMQRTAARPLPAGRVRRGSALRFALACGLAGPLILAVTTNAAAAGLALATLLIYVLIYTPLKVLSPLNTLVGAIVGALPPLIGAVAASGVIPTAGWVLAGILFLWQIPHSLALAWMYRADYERGGFCMLPVLDPSGHLTGCVTVIYSLLLLPLPLLLTLYGVTGPFFAVGALLLGLAFLVCGVVLERARSAPAARRVFLASVLYLPLLLGLMVVDRQVQPASPGPSSPGSPRVERRAPDVTAAEVGPLASDIVIGRLEEARLARA
ncbi:MAG: protoheme IX farnesyltransferase [Phycisphaerales bacterium]|nr:protoheme IX farnesyltransferase [Phycisphaerales bacterium]